MPHALLSPLQVGDLLLPNRIIMAPLTRCRASHDRVPNAMMAQYYSQRASYGLILTEATAISPMAVGYPNTPGIWNDEQINAWKPITEAVHARGGHIMLQLWHVGRISDPFYLNGETPVAPSAIPAKGHVSLMRPLKAYGTPRALELNEIPAIVEAYRQAALNAQAAGFDGVEIHAANGYLIDQFLQDSTNHRDDIYGGSIENRCRLLLEITDAILSVWSPGRVGVHFSPRGDTHDMGDSNRTALFLHAARELGKRNLAFLCVRESASDDALFPAMKAAFGGILIANEKFTEATARLTVECHAADAVAFGKAAIANPDLVERIRNQAPWNEPQPQFFYGDGPQGYTDYPFLSQTTTA